MRVRIIENDINTLSILCSVQVPYEFQFLHKKVMRDILQSFLLYSQNYNWFRCINYRTIKNLNQDILKSGPEKNRSHWASHDVTNKDVISDDVIFSID